MFIQVSSDDQTDLPYSLAQFTPLDTNPYCELKKNCNNIYVLLSSEEIEKCIRKNMVLV